MYPSDLVADPEKYLTFITSKNFESQYFERKQITEGMKASKLREIVFPTVSGFANSNREGGILVLGVKDNGEISGINLFSEQLKNTIFQQLKSLKGLSFNLIEVNCKNHHEQEDYILLIYIEYSATAICETSEGQPRTWERMGSQNLKMNFQDMERVMREKGIIDFESRIAQEYNEDEIESEVYEEFKADFIRRRLRNKELPFSSKFEFLRSVKAVRVAVGKRHFTQAGSLFFSKNPKGFNTSAYVRLMKYDEKLEKAKTHQLYPTFDRDFDGPIVVIIREIGKWFSDYTFFREFVKRDGNGILKQEEYPLAVVTEMVINALIHRDYGVKKPIFCIAYSDAFVVKSPGNIPQRAPKEFKLGEIVLDSAPRNMLIVDWTRTIADGEDRFLALAMGEGTKKMFDKMLKFGLPPPSYINNNETTVILYNQAEKRKDEFALHRQPDGNLDEAHLLELSALHLGDHKNFYSEGDITFQDKNYIERIDQETNTTVETIFDTFIKQNRKAEKSKRLFLLLGEAGMGKTWLLTKIALKYGNQNYPIFFITLRDGIEQKLSQIFNLKERTQIDYQLIELQKNLSKWLIIIFDGYDEIQYENDKGTLINRYLNLLQNQLKNTLIIISSRRFDWLNDEFTRNGKSLNIINNIWPNDNKQNSYYLQKFSEQERISAFNQYKSLKVPELNTWHNKLFELSFIPIWMRLICEIYKKGETPSFFSTNLYNAYFDRASLKNKHYELIGEIAELFLEKKQNFNEKFSMRTKDFKGHATQIQELHSKNILMESKEQNQRIAKSKFLSPHFGYYGLAYQLYSKIHDLKEAKENKRTSKQNLLKNFVINLDKLEPNLVNTISTLASQITKEHGDKYNIQSILEESRQTRIILQDKETQIYNFPRQQAQKITITQLIAAIQRIEKIYSMKNIPLLRIAKQLNITVEEVRTPLEDAIFEERIKGTIDDQETINENDDVLRLDENWNVVHIIQDKLNKAKILLQPRKISNLDKAKKLLQELEAYRTQEEEINTKEQLLKEINEITIHDKFYKINILLRNANLQNLEQAREILQRLKQDNLSENHQLKLQELSEMIESQAKYRN